PVREEALLAGQPVLADLLRALPDGDPVGGVPDGQPADVPDVLPDGQGTVDGVPGRVPGLLPVELLDEGIPPRLDGLAVLGGPPVAQVAPAVEGRPGIVEAVPDLVADDRTDAAVVVGVVALRVEEGRLQDRGGEDDLVQPRVVVGVDRL